MAKFKLQPDPTFKRKVGLTTHDGKVVEVEFTFRHRTRDKVKSLAEELKNLDDAAVIKLVATGWELEEEFNDESVRTLTDNYAASSEEVFNTYIQALRGAREGN